MAGVFIDLYKDDGDGVLNKATDTLVDRQQTAANGSYTFANVADGDYFIQEEVPANFTEIVPTAQYHIDVIGGGCLSGNDAKYR